MKVHQEIFFYFTNPANKEKKFSNESLLISSHQLPSFKIEDFVNVNGILHTSSMWLLHIYITNTS
jgi:hypothetical protein